METRSRKRGEARAAQRPSSSGAPAANKRARLEASASAPPPPSRRATRSAAAAVRAMDDETAAAKQRKEEIEKKGKQKESEIQRDVEVADAGQGKEILSSEYDEEGEDEEGGSEDFDDDEYDDYDDGIPEGHPGRHFSGSASDLRGMLRRLAVFGLPSGGAEEVGKLKRILASLRDEADDFSQIGALTELCEILPFASEELRDRFNVDSFVPILVGFLNQEGNPDVMLLAARALTHICDIFPSSCTSVVHHGAIPCFCARLLTIEYMDLAEQSLQALEKISHRHASACLRAGALMAVLSYLDFFSSGVKRVALSTAANISKQLSPDTIDSAMEAIPTLTSLLSDPDAKVVEHASVCLARIAGTAALSPEKLEKLSSYGLVSQVASLISVTNSGSGQASLSSPTYSAVIGLLSTCARGSVVFTRELLEMGISGILRDILTGSGFVSQIPNPLSLNGPKDQLCEIVSLVNDLLPSILHETISLPTSHAGSSHSSKKLMSRSCTDNSDREKLFRENPDLLLQFGRDLFPLMIQVYGSSINTQVRHKCLAVVSKVLCLSTADMLNSLLQATNISSFLAGVLTGKDIEVLLPALQIAEVLVQKLPELFSKMFMKEGVVHAVDALISSGSTLSGKDKICATGTLLKTRRNKKISGGSTNEVSGMEETKDSNETKTSSSSPLVPGANLDLKVIISAHARRFKDAYIAANLGSAEAGSTDSLCKLTNLCKKLSGSFSVDLKAKTKSKGKGKKNRFVVDSNDQISSIADILAEVSKDDGVSTFEFVKSGVIGSLIDYFAGGGTHKENMSQADLMKHHKETLGRFQAFVDLSLPLDYQGKEAPLLILIRKLQDALASLEHFPVVLSQGSKSHSDNPSSLAGLNAFRRPLKLRLRRAHGEKSLGDHMSSILHIDPLADITDVEDYLWSRVQRNETEFNCGVTEPAASTQVAVEGRPPTRSRSLTAAGSASTNSMDSLNSRSSKEKGKSVSRSVDGPQTRSAARRRVALEGEPQRKQQNLQSSEEEDDPFVAPVELEQTMALEEDGDDDDDDDVEEMFMEEPASVCVVERVGGVDLRDLVGGAAMASTSAATDTITIQASASLKGVSSYRDNPRLNFFIGGKLLDRSSTLFHAIQHNMVPQGDEPRFTGSEYPFRERFWDEVHIITYRRADALAKRNFREPQKMSSISMTIKNVPFIDNILQRKLPCDLEKSDSTHDILLLLRVVEGLNGLASCLRSQSLSDAFAEGKLKSLDDLKVDVHLIPQEEFLSGKLTSKLARQLQDAVTLCSIGLPPWCHQLIKVCPFLFSFETRRQYFYSTALGVQRALHRLQQQQVSQNLNVPNNRGRHVGRIQRQKVRVSRKRILESAAKVMELCCGQKTLLEVEYYNEVGTGLGPTLEFYTLISREMQRSMLGMWRSNSSSAGTVQDGDFVQASHGLFPRPYPPHTDSSGGSKTNKVIENFCLLGRLMAKALQDGRLLDLPLSTAFYKLVLGKELDIYDIKSFDVELGTTLIEMQALVRRKQFLESISGDKKEEISSLHYRGARIEDLCIDFTLPGFLDYPLKPGGSNILVTIDNLDEYVSLVVDATIKTGIMPQMEALRSGFNQVLCMSTLQVFSENEMDTLLCGVRDLWVAEMLTDQIKFDHGYTAQSPPILNFLAIMAEFTPSQQRAFLQFITGCPRLPPGGLSALNPKLTVVRKSSAGPTDLNSLEVVDADLPSVMTCANYLKLPPYSTKEVMRDRLLYAITEGQGSFDLS